MNFGLISGCQVKSNSSANGLTEEDYSVRIDIGPPKDIIKGRLGIHLDSCLIRASLTPPKATVGEDESITRHKLVKSP